MSVSSAGESYCCIFILLLLLLFFFYTVLIFVLVLHKGRFAPLFPLIASRAFCLSHPSLVTWEFAGICLSTKV